MPKTSHGKKAQALTVLCLAWLQTMPGTAGLLEVCSKRTHVQAALQHADCQQPSYRAALPHACQQPSSYQAATSASILSGSHISQQPHPIRRPHQSAATFYQATLPQADLQQPAYHDHISGKVVQGNSPATTALNTSLASRPPKIFLHYQPMMSRSMSSVRVNLGKDMCSCAALSNERKSWEADLISAARLTLDHLSMMSMRVGLKDSMYS